MRRKTVPTILFSDSRHYLDPRLCRVEDESVQLNALLLRVLIDWADLAARHSFAMLQAVQKGQEAIGRFVAAGVSTIW